MYVYICILHVYIFKSNDIPYPKYWSVLTDPNLTQLAAKHGWEIPSNVAPGTVRKVPLTLLRPAFISIKRQATKPAEWGPLRFPNWVIPLYLGFL